MSWTLALLIALVIVLTIGLMGVSMQMNQYPRHIRVMDCVDRRTGQVTTVAAAVPKRHPRGCNCRHCMSPEDYSASQQREYFEGDIDEPLSATDFQFSAKTYLNDMSFGDFVAKHNLDPATISNHARYVDDRMMKDPSATIGRPTILDAHESYNPIPWQGLRRPRKVAVDNPTQIADVDYDAYEDYDTIAWGRNARPCEPQC